MNMIKRFERFSFAISEMSKYWHKIAAEEMENYGMRSTHSIYLLTLARSSDGMTATQLCDACGKDKSDVSRVMALMIQKGIVQKNSDEHKIYKSHYALTPAGREMADHICIRAARAVEIAGGDVSEEHREIFYETMETIVNNLRALSKDGIPS